ncbi:MAG: zinc-ribbon domain-containing protein, partial [Promethearchaeota archaeon]
MVNFCSECGKPVRSDWKVCPYCSHPLYRMPKDIIEKISGQESTSV